MENQNKTFNGNSDCLYGASQRHIEEVSSALSLKDYVKVGKLISSLSAPDVADLITNLKFSYRHQLIKIIKGTIDPEVLPSLTDIVRDEVIAILGTKGFADIVSNLETDEAIDLIEDLTKDEQKAVLKAVSPEDRIILEEGLSYPEDSAGRLMQREVVCVPSFWSIDKVINHIRVAESLPEKFYNIYVVDPRYHPIGVVSLSCLLRQKKKALISEVMDTFLRLIPVTMDQEDVAQIFRHYALQSVPVVLQDGRLVGVILVDDVVNVIDEEAEEDIMHLSGVSETDFYASVFVTVFKRAPWLIISLLNAIITIFVISQFETSIQRIPTLAFFLPVAAMMGGNAGLQVVTVIVRALTTRELRPSNASKAIWKELMVGIINGSFFALSLGAVAGFWEQNIIIGIVVFGSLISNIIWAAFAGVTLPIIIDYFDLDPAVSASPMLTVTTDVLGYTIYLALASLLLL